MYGYMPMYYFDPTYVLIIIGVLLSMGASAKLNATYGRYSSVASRCGMTGAQAAQRILQSQGIYDVTVRHVSGRLTDHYDPRSKTVNLSDAVYGSTSIAAIGVAAHECGHAIQDQEDYVPLRFRSAFVPVANLGTQVAFPILLLGVFLGILMVTMAVLSGCGAKAEPKPDPGSGKYLIYYLNSSLTKLVAQEYETETKDQADLAEELMDQLLHVPRDLDCQPAVNEKVSFKTCRISCGVQLLQGQ